MSLDPVLLNAFKRGWEPPERLSVPEFGARYVTLPASYAIQGPFDANRSRYMLEVFKALQDDKVRIVVIQAAVQTGKTLLGEVLIPYLISNAPSNIMYLCQDEDMAKKIADTRINPILYNCAPIKQLLPLNRFYRKKTHLLFATGTSLIIGGANEGNLQSLSVRYLIGDEVWLWKQGHLQQFMARAAAFPNTSKILIISQGAEEGHDFTDLWKKGHQAEWGWTCPKCQQLQEWTFNSQRADGTWGGIKWTKDETTKPDGKRYDLVKVGPTARLECIHCKEEILDTPVTRRALNDSGSYVVTNPNADPSIKSFRWNAMANMDITFNSVVTQYLQAKESDETLGYRIPLQHFTQKVLAKTWNPNLQIKLARAAIEEYDPSKDWDNEVNRFLTVDVQSDCFWAVCRAWSKTGESRLIWSGRLETVQQVRDKQVELKVKDQKVFLDCGFDSMRVYGYCVQNGHWGIIANKKLWLCWNALKGSQYPDFTHSEGNNREKRIYSQPYTGNPALGKGAQGNVCYVYHFASDTASDILQRHFSGKGPKFLIPKDNPEYTEHLNSEAKRKDTDSKTGRITWRWTRIGTRPNHLRDCEKMQIVCAAMAGILGTNQAAAPKPAPAPTPAPTPASVPEPQLTL